MRKVLIVDPSLYSRMTLRDLVGGLGFAVCEASLGSQALEDCERLRPDIVMVDASLKDMEAANVIEQLSMRYPTLSLVICASAGQRVLVNDAYKAGAAAFCAKPYREKNISDTLKNLSRQPNWN